VNLAIGSGTMVGRPPVDGDCYGMNSGTPAISIAIGVPTIAVGQVSLFTEIRVRAR